jgi:TonB-dependent starch-binding outer membrane protein SusC
MKPQPLFSTLFCFFILNGFLAAQKIVSGVVKDKNGPLVDASVVVKKTTIGAVTDVDGRFTLAVPDSAKVLIASYVGYLHKEVKIQDHLTIELEEDPRPLCADPLIIPTPEQIAYARQTTPSLWITQKRFNEGNINDPLALIQNKAAGLSISKVGSNPNTDYFGQIRSLHNLNALSSPLIVLDGVPNTPLSMIDPKDIESIEVLKDGAASARWGLQASGGVLNITSKSDNFTPPDASGQALRISYSPQVSVETISNSHQNLSADDYIAAGGSNLKSSQNWLKNVSRIALSHAHNLALGGNSNGSNYRIALNYRNVQGVQLEDGFEQLNSWVKFGQKMFNDKLHVQLSGGMTRRKSRFAEEEAFRYAITHNPTAPIEDPNNTPNGGFFEQSIFDDFDPVAILKQSNREGKQIQYMAQGQASYELHKNLTINVLGNIYQADAERGEDYQKQARFRGQSDNGLAISETDKRSRQFFNAFGQYEWGQTKWTLKTQIGYDFQDFRHNNLKIQGSQFPTTSVSYKDLSAARDIQRDIFQDTSRLIAFYGQTHFSWNNLLDARLSLRREGSSRLAVGKKWGWLPAVSVGVKLNELLGLPNTNLLRLRGSWALTGSLPLQSGLSQNIYGFNNKQPVISKNGNSNLTFEKKNEWNIGVDAAFFNHRVRANLDYYQRRMTDLIYYFSNTPVGLFEFSGIHTNAGDVSASGTEGGISAVIFRKANFTWTSELNAATFKNRLNSINHPVFRFPEDGQFTGRPDAPGMGDTYISIVKGGLPIGNLLASQFAGVDSKGRHLIFDANGNSVLNDTETWRGYPVSAQPKWSLGWNNYFTYRKWDAQMSVRGVFGHKLANTYRLTYENSEPGSIRAYNRIQTEKAVFGLKEAK